jgi:hypothetical protein
VQPGFRALSDWPFLARSLRKVPVANEARPCEIAGYGADQQTTIPDAAVVNLEDVSGQRIPLTVVNELRFLNVVKNPLKENLQFG